MNRSRHDDLPRLGDLLDARGDVDSVSGQQAVIVDDVIDSDANIIGFSVFCSACTGEGIKIEEALNKKGIRDKVRTTAGGCVLTEEDVQKMGADRFGSDAFEAVEICRTFMSELGA